MGIKDIHTWLLENNPTVENRVLWSGLVNSVWFYYHTEPLTFIKETEIKELISRAEKFGIFVPSPVMELMLQLNEQLSSNDINVETILKLQNKIDQV